MGDEHERARELEQALLQDLEGGDVEVVGRLVEEQHVGRLEHQPRHEHARPLPAGEPSHRRLQLLGAEEEALGPARDVHRAALDDHAVARGGQRPRQRHVGVEAAVLIEDHDAQAGRVLDRALVGRIEAGEHPQHRGLAAAVAAEQPEARARRQHEVEAAHDGPPAQPAGRAAGHHEAARPAIGGGERDARGRGARAAVEVDQLVRQAARLVDARLRLARPRLRLAREPVQLAAHAVPQRLLVRRLAGQGLVLLPQVVAVAPPRLEHAGGERAVQLQHAPGHGLEEVAVVAHGHEGLGLPAQQLLEPEDPVHVEMVGGLVEEQHLRLAGQRGGDGQPLAPAAGQLGQWLLGVAEPALAQGDRDPRVAMVLGHRGGVGRGLDHLAHGGLRAERRVLGHVPDAQAPARRPLPGGRRLEPGQDLQQRRLPRPVGPDEAHVVALEDAEGQPLEQGGGTEILGEILYGEEEVGHRGGTMVA